MKKRQQLCGKSNGGKHRTPHLGQGHVEGTLLDPLLVLAVREEGEHRHGEDHRGELHQQPLRHGAGEAARHNTSAGLWGQVGRGQDPRRGRSGSQ